VSDVYERLLAEVSRPYEVWAPALAGQKLGRLRLAALAAVELHKPVESVSGHLQCGECADQCHSGSGLACDQPCDALYPCSTIRAVARALDMEAPE
jgi:hypothetical protein